MENNEEDIFHHLAEDKDIAAALADHEASCTSELTECPACRFFNNVHEMRHFADMVDAAKAVEMSAYPIDFVTDAQVIIQFLAEATRYFFESADWDEDYEEGLEMDDE